MIHLRSRKRVKDRKGHKMAAACIYKPIKHPHPHRATGYIGWLHNARAHGTKVFAHTESNKVMGTRQNHISEACLPEVHESFFPRDDNTLISHAPLKFLKRNCAIGGSLRQLTVDFSPFPDRDTLASLIFGTCWCTENYCDKKGKAILAFWNICDMYHRRKKRSIVCSSFGDISGSHVFFVVSSLCGLFLLLTEPPPLPLRWGVTLAGK